MASPGFQVDTSVYTDVAAHLESVRSDIDSATSTLRGTIDGQGNPWGDDEQGSLFGQIYTRGLQHVLDAMTTHQDQLTYAADSLRESARAHDDNDRGVAETFDGLGGAA